MKKGFVAWLSTKIGVLIFATIIFASFFFIYAAIQNIEAVDDLNKITENAARIIDSAAAAPGYFQTTIDLENIDRLEINTHPVSGNKYIQLNRGTNSGRKNLYSNVTNVVINNPTHISITNNYGIIIVS